MRTPQEKYQTALDKIYELIDKVQQLEHELEQLKDGVSEEVIENDDAWEQLDVVVFLRDIGFDPDRLPSSVGERMDIRKRLESPIPDLTEALEECQEQYGYLEKHYDRAFELGYDPITKEFYCRACSRAGRED